MDDARQQRRRKVVTEEHRQEEGRAKLVIPGFRQCKVTDRAAGVWRMQWTQIGDLWGMVPADGRRIELRGMDYFRVAGGQIVRTRHVEDWLGVMIQLGAFGS